MKKTCIARYVYRVCLGVQCQINRFQGSRRHLVGRTRVLGETGASTAKIQKVR